MSLPRIVVPQEALSAVCRKWGIRRLMLFGSVLREDFRPDSDVDVLVEFEPGTTPSLFGLEELRAEISALYLGREVDLFTLASLKPRLTRSILDSSQELYAA